MSWYTRARALTCFYNQIEAQTVGGTLYVIFIVAVVALHIFSGVW